MNGSAADSTSRDTETLGQSSSAPQVPDFKLIRPIGKGGFGEVWLATNRATGRLRAVKMISLKPSDAADRMRLLGPHHRQSSTRSGRSLRLLRRQCHGRA